MLNSKESLSEKFIKRGFWLYLFSFIVGPVGYIIKIILSNDLSVEEIGILYGIVSLVVLLTVYHDLGLTEALNFFLPKYIVENDYDKFKSALAYALLAQIPTSIFIGSVLFFSSEYLSVHYFNAGKIAYEAQYALQIFCLFFIGMNLYSILSTVYGATQNTKYQKGTEFVRMLSILAFTVMFWYSGMGTLINYSWTWILGLVFGILFSYNLFYRKYYIPYLKSAKIYFDKKLFFEIFSYALWVLLAVNVGTILSQVDMQLIIYILGPRDAGYYTNYLSIIGIPFLVVTPIIGFLFPVISELNSNGNTEKITVIKSIFYKYFGVIALVISGFMLVFGEQIAYVLFGEKFRFSGIILQYGAIFLIFNFLLQINFQILGGVGRVKERVKILGVGLLFNIPLNLILIFYFRQFGMGTVGSSLAVGLSWIPIFYLSHRATSVYKAKFDYRFFLKNLFLAGILNLIMYKLVLPYFGFADRINNFILILFILFLYIITIALFNQNEFRLFIKELKNLRQKQ
ncbi:MAG: oligosaccharide flippase family protein [Candidatus Gracilibacteria bacterium]|nr:oligosaccharide flippase family protein [Candidatus Gracilibacteria bacterium]